MELERHSHGREDSDYRNGRISSSFSDSDSRPLTPRTSESGQELQAENIPEDHESLVEEVKQLRLQLHGATEKWARDKQMFAQVKTENSCLLKP